MKKSTFIFNIAVILILGAAVIGFIQPDKNTINYTVNTTQITEGNKLSVMIEQKRSLGNFNQYNLFTPSTKEANAKTLSEFVRDGAFMTLKKDALNKILDDKSLNVNFVLPTDNGSVELEMTKVTVMPDDFKLLNLSTGEKTNFTGKALFYRGIIKGNNNSMASISIFDDFVMGVIADNSGNYTLGSIKDAGNRYTENYVYYNDRKIIHQKPFICGDEGREDQMRFNNPSDSKHSSGIGDNTHALSDSIFIYYETDHQMYLDNNSNENTVAQFVSGFFNSVAMIYQSEGINFRLNQNMGFWQNQDPYAASTDAFVILNDFGSNKKDNFFGDLAQLLSTGHNGTLGGIAWINVLCAPYTSSQGQNVGRFSFANIDNTPLPYPTYSWTVTVSTHEMGHNLGSYHTHACHWNSLSGFGGPSPIDTCIVTQENASPSNGGEGCINHAPANSCYQSNNLLTSGFIMSYCHFCADQGGGINLNNGFGRPSNSFWSQSGDTIRLRVNQAACLHSELNSSETPATYVLLQNYPNPYNPSTNIKFALPKAGFVTLRIYDITGREIAKLIDNQYYGIGVFGFAFDAGSMGLASGVYLYKLDVANDGKGVYSQFKKMVLLK